MNVSPVSWLRYLNRGSLVDLANFLLLSVLRSQRKERKDINEGLTGQIPKIWVCACSLQQRLFQRLLRVCPQLTVPTGFLKNSFADGFLLRSPEWRQVQAIQNYWISVAMNKGGHYHKVISLDLFFLKTVISDLLWFCRSTRARKCSFLYNQKVGSLQKEERFPEN